MKPAESSLVPLLKARRHLIVAFAVCCGVLSFISAYLSPRIFRAEALIVPIGARDTFGVADSLQSLSGLALLEVRASRPADSVALLGSRSVAEQFIEDQGLVEVLGAIGLLGFRYREPTKERAFRYFDTRVRRVREIRTGLIAVAMDWPNPREAAKWSNEFIAMADEVARMRAVADSERAIEHLDRVADQTALVTVRQAMYRALETEIQGQIATLMNQEFAFRVIDPAVEPDSENPVKPNTALIAVMGSLGGACLGIFFALLASAYTRL